MKRNTDIGFNNLQTQLQQIQGWNNDMEDLVGTHNLLRILEKKITFPALQNNKSRRKIQSKKLQTLPVVIQQAAKKKSIHKVHSAHEQLNQIRLLRLQKEKDKREVHSPRVKQFELGKCNTESKKLSPIDQNFKKSKETERNKFQKKENECNLKKLNKSHSDLKPKSNSKFELEGKKQLTNKGFVEPKAQKKERIDNIQVNQFPPPRLKHQKIFSAEQLALKTKVALFGDKRKDKLQQNSRLIKRRKNIHVAKDSQHKNLQNDIKFIKDLQDGIDEKKEIKWILFNKSQDKFSKKHQSSSNSNNYSQKGEQNSDKVIRIKQKQKKETFQNMIWIEQIIQRSKLASYVGFRPKNAKTEAYECFIDQHLQSPYIAKIFPGIN